MMLKNLRIVIAPLFAVFLSLLLVLKQDVVLAIPQVERMVLPNQLVLLVAEEHSLPLVTLHLLVDAGSRRDPPDREGLTNLTAKGLLLGTAVYSVTAFNETLDFMGASLNASVGKDATRLRLRILKKDLDKGFDLFMGALTSPTFPDGELQRTVEKTLAAIQSAEERPGEIAQKAFQNALFVNNPYGHPLEGTERSLPKITRDEVLQFHQAYYHSNNAILAVAGDITIEEVKEKLIPRLSQWPTAEIPGEHFSSTFARRPETVLIDRSVTQANIIFGHRGISRNNRDYYAVTVMNYILGGGGFGSRLFEEIRVRRGLAYSVASRFIPGRHPGAFQISLQTKNISAQEAISVLREEMDRIRREPVSKEELEKAKKYLVGSFPLGLDTQAKLANFITRIEYHGLGLDYCERYPSYINAVTQENVLRAAKCYLHPENAILVIVGNLGEAGIAE